MIPHLTAATKGDKGYVSVEFEYKNEVAHRLVYEALVEEVPVGKIVMHRCDVTQCIAPRHLQCGSQQDNMDDMASKGRGATSGIRGEEHGLARLTEEDVREIRRLYVEDRLSQVKIGKIYNVSQPTISDIVNYRNWRHVA